MPRQLNERVARFSVSGVLGVREEPPPRQGGDAPRVSEKRLAHGYVDVLVSRDMGEAEMQNTLFLPCPQPSVCQRAV